MDFRPDQPSSSQETAQADATPDPELPSYSRNASASWDVPPVRTDHVYRLPKKTGEQWLTLTLRSRARDSDDTPIFFQGGVIAGSLEADFEKEESIDSISAFVSTNFD